MPSLDNKPPARQVKAKLFINKSVHYFIIEMSLIKNFEETYIFGNINLEEMYKNGNINLEEM